MGEKILKEILDVVIDIKAEQKDMKEKMNQMEEKMDKMATEQLIMNEEVKVIKNDVSILNFKVTSLMKEQEDTKYAIGACVQKIRRS